MSEIQFAHQISSALVGIAIAGELRDGNGRHAGLVEIPNRFVNLSPLSTPNLQLVSQSGIQTGFHGTRSRSTEQPIYHRRNPFLQG